MKATLSDLQTALQTGSATAVSLLRDALARADDPNGEGSRVFTRVYRDRALAAAEASDRLRASGVVRSPLEGLPISIKDLFDVAGEPTMAGSRVLRDAPAATADATVVRRLINAGAVITGKTNMVEFAFSGVGLNPHYGTPSNPWDRSTRRIPGGSSSGAGVAVADQMSVLSIGSDTGGSVRIPSALCGLTGFKPTARRVSMQGVLPLSSSLDSIGGLCASVADCAVVDAILTGEAGRDPSGRGPEDFVRHLPLAGLRLALPTNLVFDGVDETVRRTFDDAIRTLRAAGAHLDELEFSEFGQLARINAQGGLTGAEAWAWHRELLATHQSEYDPRVASRIARCETMTAADYIDVLGARRAWIRSVEDRMAPYDAMVMPTVPIVAPPIADLEASDEVYFAANGLILRNPTLINFLDGCALSLPCHQNGHAPVGLMVAGRAMQDHHILAVGAAIETALQGMRRA